MIQTYNAGNGVVTTVIWLTSEHEPTTPAKASFARLTSSDGESAVFVVNAGKIRAARFNPDQPRDEQGQWTTFLHGPKDALNSLLNEESANIDRDSVRTFFKLASDQVEDPNLVNLHVDGKAIFSQRNLGIKREDMPQVPKERRVEFLNEMTSEGVGIARENVNPFSIFPTQSEISARRVGVKIAKHEKDPDRPFAPILVSRDGHILDGHHHWGSMAATAIEEPRVKIPIYRLDLSTRDALERMHEYDRRHGIARESLTGLPRAAEEKKPEFEPWVSDIDDEEEEGGKPRAAEFDPNQPRDEEGKWTDTGASGSGIASSPHLADQTKTAIAAGERLLSRAVEEADYGSAGEVKTWDDLSSDKQNQVREQWIQNEYENGVDVDMSGVEQDMLNDLRRDNDDIIKETEEQTLERLADRFPNENPLLPGVETDNFRRIDPETLTVGDDDGDGAPLVDLEEVRFTDGSELTAKEQELLSRTWNQEYDAAIQAEVDKFGESNEWQEAVNELESQILNNQWNSFSDKEKLALAANFDVEISGDSVSPGEPEKWVTGSSVGDHGSEDYGRTHAIANRMTELRMAEILKERGLKANPERHIEETWSRWKVSSHSVDSNALQLASARELGGVHRLNAEELKAISDRFTDNDLAVMQAHVRAQWETTQYVMHRAGENEVNVYRAIYIPTGDAKREYYDRSGNKREDAADFVKLPDTSLLRAGAQSTTAVVDVANNWGGTGKVPTGSSRVVLRIRAPRTSVLSLPVFGDNVQEEYETVLLGTKDKWRWDLWLGKAPTFQQLKAALAYLRALAKKMTRKNRKVVIDLQAADRQLPGHWLKGTDPALTATVARIQKQRARQPRTAARRRETTLHRTADSFASKFEVAVRLAFALGRKAMKQHPGSNDSAVYAVYAMRKSLEETLPKLLRKAYVAGGETGAGMLRTAEWDESKHPRDEQGQFTSSQPKDEKEQWSDVGVKDTGQHYYHRTTREALEKIRQEGLKPGEDTEGVSLATDLEAVKWWAQQGISKDAPVLLRVKKSGLDVEQIYTDVVTSKNIPVRELEVYQHGKWRALKRTDRKIGPFSMRFDVNSPEAVDWADRHAAELIHGITETSREQINNAIAEALEHGNLRDAYQEILDAVGDSARAELIARTEVMTAVHEGQRAAWRQATEEGLLSGNERRTWIATGDENTCPICDGLDGQVADFDGEYPGGYGGPPAHPRCRCTEGLT